MVLNRSKALWCLLLTMCVSLSWLLWYKPWVWTSVNNIYMFKFSPLTVNSEDKYITHYIEDIRNYTNSTLHTLGKDAFIFDYREKNISATVALEIRNKVQKIMKPWQTIQVYRPNVNPMDMHWVTNLQQLRKANQTDWIEHRVKTCAVVGNSGILLGSNCGPTIDSMDTIIRMNLAEFGSGYSSDVGSRLTYMTINREQLRLVLACFFNMTKGDVEELRTNTTRPVLSAECDNFIRRFGMIREDVLWLFKGRLPGLQEVLSLLRKRFGLRFKFAYSPLDPINPTLKLWKQKYPTTGLAMYTAATQLCDEISLFGFYPFYTDDYNRTVLHHYYEPELKDFEVHHEMPKEYKIFLDLDRKGALRLIKNCTSNGISPRRHGL